MPKLPITEIVREAQPVPELEECPGCNQMRDDVDVRYSYGYYAGRYCVPCAKRKYNDQCGIDRPMGNPQELDDYGNDGDY